jgi:glycosyltransferase, group 2 family
VEIQVIIPVYRPDARFLQLLCMIKIQSLKNLPVLLIDSGKGMSYAEEIKGMNVKVRKINIEEFNHGGTRQWGMDLCSGADIYVFLTQDAVFFDEYAVENLVAAFTDDYVGCAYGRQVPHRGSGVFGAFARKFNYPLESHIYAIEDKRRYGIKTVFISNSFAAYRKEAIQQVHGFPKHTILSEDMCVAAKMLLQGWKIAYVANAAVYHSHDYTIFQEFKRYFDIGVFHAREPWIQQKFGKAEGEGKRFIMTEFRYVLKRCPYRFFEMILRDGMKFLGYRLGRNEKYLKNKWKMKLSMSPRYWDV